MRSLGQLEKFDWSLENPQELWDVDQCLLGDFIFLNSSKTLVSTFSVLHMKRRHGLKFHKTGAVRKDVLPSLETVRVITGPETVDCELQF